MPERAFNDERAAMVAAALAHPLRLRILDLLRDEGAYVMHLTHALGRPQAVISQHLMVLRAVGLVRDRREGVMVMYNLADPQVARLVDAVREVAASLPRPQGVEGVPRPGAEWPRRGRMTDCGCPRCRGPSPR